MDSPTLLSFDYEHFWFQQKQYQQQIPSHSLSVETSATEHAEPVPEVKVEDTPINPQPPTRKRTRGKNATSEEYRSTKNLAKNFGKAITSFALSDLAIPYLNTILQREKLSRQDFVDYMKAAKETIQSIDSFRACLLQHSHDSEKLKAQKKAFQAIGMVFIKYFSVNWITHGRISNKMIYLKSRFKILRRIERPETFTYLQTTKNKRKDSKQSTP